jgi:predicted O-methyltransferase YrrM
LLLGPDRLAPSARLARSVSQRLFRFAHTLDAWWVRRMVRRAAGPGAVRVRTYTHPWELSALYKLAATCLPGGAAVEIGSHLGASACYLAAGLRRVGGTLVCIDTWRNDAMPDEPADTFDEFRANTAGVAGLITPVRKNSRQLVDSDLPGRYVLGFIDGDHSYAGARADFLALAPRIEPKGVLAFHDSLNVPGVGRVIGEALVGGEWVLAGQVLSLTWLRKLDGHVEGP